MIRHTMMTMTKPVHRVTAAALRAATSSGAALARQLGISQSGLCRYGLGDRTPPPALLRRLARLLRVQARRLERHAARLEQEAQKEARR